MGKAKLNLIVIFVVTLGAGVTAGMLVPRLLATRHVATRGGTPLAAELGLSAAQNNQMRDIWEGVRDKVDACFQHAQEAQKRRDDLVVAMLTAQQKAQFEHTQRDYAAALDSIKTDRDAAFRDAVKRTEEMLNGPQKERYRQILYARLGAGGAAAATPPDWVPTSQPATPVH